MKNTEHKQYSEIYRRLGVHPIIHAAGTTTRYSGTLIHPDVLKSMEKASKFLVNIEELNKQVGKNIARITGAEAALVTTGSAGAMTLQAAACIAGKDPVKISKLPNAKGMKNEIIIHKAHRLPYDQQYIAAGARFVEIGWPREALPWQLEEAINENTAALVYIISAFTSPKVIPFSEAVQIAHKHNVPVLVDAASTLPPRDNLFKFLREGADMVAVSGGKGIRGPQSTGLLYGKKDLIEAAALNTSPNPSIGRGMKVSKEEIVGVLTALEIFLERDEEADMSRWRHEMQQVVDAFIEMPGLRPVVEHDENNYLIPQAVIYFEQSWNGPRGPEIAKALLEGDPPISLSPVTRGDEICVDPFSLQPGELEVVIRRLSEELSV